MKRKLTTEWTEWTITITWKGDYWNLLIIFLLKYFLKTGILFVQNDNNGNSDNERIIGKSCNSENNKEDFDIDESKRISGSRDKSEDDNISDDNNGNNDSSYSGIMIIMRR